MTTKQNDDLAALAGQAEALQAEAGADAQGEGGAQAAEPARQTNGQLLAGTFHLAREVGCALGGVQSPRMVLDDPTLQQLGDAWGAVADKRGWDLQKIMGDYAAEVAAVMLTITIGTRLNRAIQAELAARDPKPAQAPAPAADSVVEG